jgi:hypothetical protein
MSDVDMLPLCGRLETAQAALQEASEDAASEMDRQRAQRMEAQVATLHPKPETRNPKPETLNPQPSTLNTQPSTLNPHFNPQP